jgi:hypothetical protein
MNHFREGVQLTRCDQTNGGNFNVSRSREVENTFFPSGVNCKE